MIINYYTAEEHTAEAVWYSGRASASDPARHGFKSGRQLCVILIR